MTGSPPPEPSSLAKQAALLAARVSALAAAVNHLDRRTNRGERITFAVAIGLALDLLLSVAVGLLLANQFESNDRLQAAVEREVHTRQDALCPLYGLLMSSYNPESRDEGPDRERYIASFEVLRESYRALDCTDPLSFPPRSQEGTAPR